MRALGWVYWTVAARLREGVDDLATNWILKRRTLPLPYVEALLVDLGKRLGAKIEYQQTPSGL
jgi:hypothetical protein